MTDHQMRAVIQAAERLQYRQDHPQQFAFPAVRAAYDALCRAVEDAGKGLALVPACSIIIDQVELVAIVASANTHKGARMLLEQHSDKTLHVTQAASRMNGRGLSTMDDHVLISPRRGITAGHVRKLAKAYERAGYPVKAHAEKLARTKTMWEADELRVAEVPSAWPTLIVNTHKGGANWSQEALDLTLRLMANAGI